MQTLQFGRTRIPTSQVFLLRTHIYAMVNKQPFVNGHILVCPTRKVARFSELTELELIEMWMAAQEISEKFRNEFGWELF